MAQSPRLIRPVSIERPARPRHNLPAPLTRFIGRGGDVAALTALLATTRLLTLTGPGGCGKTRLALVVAAAEATPPHGPPDGVWLVEFAALADPVLIPQAVAAILSVREEPRRLLLDTLADALAARSLLLLLDNCEHLVAPVAAMADRLLRACPHLRILATSREALRVPGEVAWRVPSLSLPSEKGVAIRTAAQLATSEAAQLFADRVRLRQPAFALADENAAAVAAICRRLDGMPLALELAAARARVLSLSQLEAHLGDALRVLTVGERTAMPHHQTLRATLDWSYALLTEQERIVLRRLAVFAGGCDLAAAEAVCDGGIAPADVLTLLAQLVEKSLVQMDERAGNARYHLLETVRQYAVEQLAVSEEDAVRSAHADWCLALTREAEAGLDGPEQDIWLERLGSELDNVRAAMHWLLASGPIGHGLRITTHLWRFWYTRDHVTEGSRWLRAFIARGRETGEANDDASAWLNALFAAGRLAIFGGDYRGARALMEEMLAVARQHDDPYHIASALMLLGHIALEQGEDRAARTCYEEGIPFAREANHPLWMAILIGSVGITQIMQGEIAAARSLLDETIGLIRQLGDVGQLSRLLRWQGVLALLEGEGERAQAFLVEGIALHQRLHSQLGIAESLEVFAALAATRGQFARALQLTGAVATLRATIAIPAPPYWQDWLAGQIEPARRALGAAASADARAAGAAMTTDQAIAEGLRSAHPAAPGDRRIIKETYRGLSARERDVAAEVAAGKTNREIAEALFISEKTVEWHIGNSLRKLGFRSRAELAVWAVAVDLVAPPHRARNATPPS